MNFPWRSSPEVKKGAVSTVVSHQVIHHPFTGSKSYEEHATIGYQNNPVVYRCVSLIAKNLSSVPLVLYKNGIRVEQHPLLQLLKKPNPLQNYQTFSETIVSHLLLSGNAFIERIGDVQDQGELYILRPDRIRLTADKNGFPVSYEYKVGVSSQKITIDPTDACPPVLHMKLFHPIDDHWGQSPLSAAMPLVAFRNASLAHNIGLLQNGGRPSGVLIVESEYEMTENQRQQLREDLDSLYKGQNNAGRMMILEGKFRWQETGLSPREMDFLEGQREAAREITQIFGIPAMCAGILLGGETFANYKEARLHMWEDTLIPFLDYLLAYYNHWLCPLFEEGLTLSFNKDSIDALAPKRDALWDRVNSAQFLTLNEKRRLLGYPPLENQGELASICA